MELIETTKEDYFNLISNPYHKFNISEFNFLNNNHVDKIFYLLFKDSKYRLGIIGGIKNSVFKSSFSAPFGGFSFNKNDVKLSMIEDSIDLLNHWCKNKNIECAKIILPPNIYNHSFIAKQLSCFYRKGYIIDIIDLNYHFSTKNLNDNYIKNIWHSARKSLNKSLNNGLIFKLCSTGDESQIAYDIIKTNRREKGFPLRMKYTDIIKTDSIIDKDYFIVYDCNEVAMASAIIYHISTNIVQVVYWGDIPEYSDLRIMNFLSYKIFDYYKNKNIEYIDIGPSSENSIPNHGLCEFKESIGCDISEKFTLAHYFVKEDNE